MDTISTLSFYLSLIFGFGFGLIAVFTIGRLGTTQFFHWLAGTSFFQDSGSKIAYISTLFGRRLGKLWLIIGIPSFILSFILSSKGYSSYPDWVSKLEIVSKFSFVHIIIGGYVLMYIVGRLISSPNRKFNKARISYERIAVSKGYWFDNWGKKNYLDAKSKKTLENVENVFQSILDILLKRNGEYMSIQRKMTLYYQQALLFCTLGKLDKGLEAINNSQKSMDDLDISEYRWEPYEKDTLKSQLYFLEGEILFLKGEKNKAKELFDKIT